MCWACRAVHWAISSNVGFESAAVDKSATAAVGWEHLGNPPPFLLMMRQL